MTSRKNKIISALVLGLLTLALAGCQKEGPAEKAGKKIDNAIGNAGDAIQKATN